MKKPTNETMTIISKTHIVQPPKISKLPKPRAEATRAKIGKQHGERIATTNIPRLLVGGVKSFVGEIPVGNTGGANVPPLKPMEIPNDLKAIIDLYPR